MNVGWDADPLQFTLTSSMRNDSPLISDLELNFDPSRHFANRKDSLQRSAVDRLYAGLQFVLPAMPGTGDATSMDGSIGQRPPLMRAHSIDRE